ncbi:MATE family efflux transporter [Corallincola spongiicola]|uniref:Multidrug-efflux transporter n=1 Tax=Corallincola spongiicola TaxID=2520508 RepID=A0ABY1WTY4_9GAMM|nr:MATE family efflux transporter [Corallincola spongiicola]TAA48205.1 MATE family efflux transporter [Corallincola spongiicola]
MKVISAKFTREIRQILRLCLPIFAANLATTVMSFIDTTMAGTVSPTDLAAVAVATSIWLPVLLLVQGLIMALSPITAHYYGAQAQHKIANAVWQTGYLGLAMVAILLLCSPVVPIIIESMVDDPHLAELTLGYLKGIVWSAPAFVIFQVLRNMSEGMDFTRPIMLIGLLGLILNVPANYVFIYGKFGLPALGGAGCGWATAIVNWCMMLGMMLYVRRHPHYKKVSLVEVIPALHWHQIRSLLRLGIPISLSLFFEVSLFAVVALLVAPLGAAHVAGHQVAINFSSMIFMIPLSIGMAVTIRVGINLGAKRSEDALYSVKSGIAFGLLIALVTAVATVALRNLIADVYTDDNHVIDLAASLLLLAAIYQLPDTVQAIGAGALRGYKDSKAIFIITLAAYWGIGLPIGYILGMTDIMVPAMGAKGFWIGFIAGLSSAAILFGLRLNQYRVKSHWQKR